MYVTQSDIEDLREEQAALQSDQVEFAGQSDPDGKNPHQKGAKLDSGKSPVFRGFVSYFPRAILRVADVSQFGSRKYTWGGWKEVEDGFNRYSDALLRHVCYEAMGEKIDPETEIEHAAHLAWNAMARLERLLTEQAK